MGFADCYSVGVSCEECCLDRRECVLVYIVVFFCVYTVLDCVGTVLWSGNRSWEVRDLEGGVLFGV